MSRCHHYGIRVCAWLLKTHIRVRRWLRTVGTNPGQICATTFLGRKATVQLPLLQAWKREKLWMMKDSESLGCRESNWEGAGVPDLCSDLMYEVLDCFAVVQHPHEAVGWGILVGISVPSTNCCLLNKNGKLNPYSLWVGIFLYRIWSFQPVCVSEDCLSFTNKKWTQKRWVPLFKTTELLPWPWAALSGYQHLGLSLGYLKNLVMDSGFIECSEIFCWQLHSVPSFCV